MTGGLFTDAESEAVLRGYARYGRKWTAIFNHPGNIGNWNHGRRPKDLQLRFDLIRDSFHRNPALIRQKAYVPDDINISQLFAADFQPGPNIIWLPNAGGGPIVVPADGGNSDGDNDADGGNSDGDNDADGGNSDGDNDADGGNSDGDNDADGVPDEHHLFNVLGGAQVAPVLVDLNLGGNVAGAVFDGDDDANAVQEELLLVNVLGGAQDVPVGVDVDLGGNVAGVDLALGLAPGGRPANTVAELIVNQDHLTVLFEALDFLFDDFKRRGLREGHKQYDLIKQLVGCKRNVD